MLTDDIQIDRRILHEAETLSAQGYEVTVLAGWQAGLPTHEKIGAIQVERITTPRFFWSEQIILSSQRQTIAFLNHLSLGYQKLMGLFARIITKFFKLLTSIGSFITLIAIGVNNLAALSLRLCQRLQPLSALEHETLQRVMAYQPDVIHAHDLPQLRVGVRVKKRLQIPLVYDAHELYAEIGSLSAAAKQDLSHLEMQSLPHCHSVITVNPFIAAEMAQRYNIPTPTVILNATTLPNGFNPASGEDRFRQHFPIPAEHQILLYQGWLSLDRGLPNLVRAMAHVPASIHLILMGYGEEARCELEKTADEAGIADRVHFKEAVPQSELLFWTASANAGIIPYQPVDLNHYYCSPNKLFEFIQAELPIIANDLPFLRQVINEEGFGLTLPLADTASYAEAIRLMFDPALGGPARFKPNLSAKKDKYDWQVEAAKLLDLYARLEVDKHRV